MQLNFKENFFGYFKFYYSVLGKKLYVFIFLNILTGLLDGIGLAMFIPLLAIGRFQENGKCAGFLIDKFLYTKLFVTSNNYFGKCLKIP